jgi:Carboxypeptidase regulatory-like domain/TonB dependent receptor
MKKSHHTFTHVSIRLILVIAAIVLSPIAGFAQETRSAVLGTVRDASGAVIAGASVEITNVDTNATTKITTNESGYYEAPYLLPATYNITVSAIGFKKHVQRGFALSVNSRANVDVMLEVGETSDSVEVIATTPLLETTSGSGTASLEQRQVSDLPTMSNSAILLARSVPGIQWTANANYLGMHSNAGGSAVSAAGGVGGNEFSLDGVPNSAAGRRVGYLPYTDTIAEFKVETAPFDASKGHTTSATVSLSTKSGTNEYHGALTWQHWQQRWNATQSTTNAAHWGRISQLERPHADDPAINDPALRERNQTLAQQLRSQSPQSSGRSNNWAGSVGGPVRVPRLYDGKDKLFFFFAYNAAKDVKSEEATAVNRTVPSDAHRRGDFSDLLKIDEDRYQIYDPRKTRCSDNLPGPCNRSGVNVIREPFPNNQVPILNPLCKYYEPLYPRANNVPGVVSREGRNNYLASATPFNWDYSAFTNRVDLQLTPKQRMFGKWSYSNFKPEDRGDWVYETVPGLLQNGLVRKNIGITFDHVYTFNSTTIFNWSIAWNRFIEGSASNEVQTSFPPSSVGLPGYLDEKAGQFIHLPNLSFDNYSDFTRGYPGFGRFSVGTIRGELSKYVGTHSLRFGVDVRQNWRATDGPGNTSGSFSYNNAYVREAQNTTNAPGIGLEWAAFMLGVPSGISVSTNDDLYLTNKFYAGYIQDDWKLSQKLTLNLGLRYELEGGFRERFNRGLYGFDLDSPLPISQAAQEAYAKSPASILALRPVSDFIVKGGTTYLGEGLSPETINEGQPGWMPRIGFAYQINDKTVLRGGWGMFYDTNNVTNDGLNQGQFNRGTGTVITDNNGWSFLGTNLRSEECIADIANCQTVLSDPFPVRFDGTRFDTPTGTALGLMSQQGRGITYLDPDWKRARQHRFRIALQRQIGSTMTLEVAYLGSRTDQISVGRRLDALPERYWATGLIRNRALARDLTSNVTNPFNWRNFAALETTHPLVYNDIRKNGFFTNNNIQKQQLLRPYPNMNGLTNGRVPDGEQVYNHLEVSATKRFSRGFSFQASYLWSSNLQRTTRQNEFDDLLVWEPSNNSVPHSLMVNFIYEFPIGKGRKFLSNNKWLNAFVGGWQIGGIYYKQSGRVYGLGNWFYYGGDLRNIPKDAKDQTTDEWFNWWLFPGASRDYTAADRSAYEARIRQIVPESIIQQMGNICESGQNRRCTYDNVTPTNFRPDSFHVRVFPNSLNWMRGHGKNQFDANLLRRFQITENKELEFRLDLLNALNHVNWDNPNTDIDSSNFGRVTTQWNTPRWIQFQLRLLF